MSGRWAASGLSLARFSILPRETGNLDSDWEILLSELNDCLVALTEFYRLSDLQRGGPISPSSGGLLPASDEGFLLCHRMGAGRRQR